MENRNALGCFLSSNFDGIVLLDIEINGVDDKIDVFLCDSMGLRLHFYHLLNIVLLNWFILNLRDFFVGLGCGDFDIFDIFLFGLEGFPVNLWPLFNVIVDQWFLFAS